MRAGHAFAEDAPETALILIDEPSAPEEPARLQRLIADAGRYGFRDLQVLHTPAAAALVADALGGLPALSPLPQTVAEAHSRPFAALAERLPRLGPRTLVMEGLARAPWNWLDLMAAVAPERAGVVALTEDGAADAAFTLEDDRAAPATGDGEDPAFAGHVILERHSLDDLSDAGSLSAALGRLGAAGRLGGRRVGGRRAEGPLAAPAPLRETRPALFLDRDGTLNVDYGYVYDPQRLMFLPGAATAVKRANDLGFYVFLVTNQSGVGRGYYSEADVKVCNATLQRHLRAFGAHLDDIRYCADHPDALLEAYRRPSGWRKPAPGMLLDLMEHWPVAREGSLMVGDKDSDVAAGHAAGVESVKFEGGNLDTFLAPRLEALSRTRAG